MPPGDRTERVRPREHREPERERDAEETDPDPGEGRRQHGAAASPENQEERPQELRRQFRRHHPSFQRVERRACTLGCPDRSVTLRHALCACTFTDLTVVQLSGRLQPRAKAALHEAMYAPRGLSAHRLDELLVPEPQRLITPIASVTGTSTPCTRLRGRM